MTYLRRLEINSYQLMNLEKFCRGKTLEFINNNDNNNENSLKPLHQDSLK